MRVILPTRQLARPIASNGRRQPLSLDARHGGGRRVDQDGDAVRAAGGKVSFAVPVEIGDRDRTRVVPAGSRVSEAEVLPEVASALVQEHGDIVRVVVRGRQVRLAVGVQVPDRNPLRGPACRVDAFGLEAGAAVVQEDGDVVRQARSQPRGPAWRLRSGRRSRRRSGRLRLRSRASAGSFRRPGSRARRPCPQSCSRLPGRACRPRSGRRAQRIRRVSGRVIDVGLEAPVAFVQEAQKSSSHDCWR